MARLFVSTPLLDLPVLIDMGGKPGLGRQNCAIAGHGRDERRAGKGRHIVERGQRPGTLAGEVVVHGLKRRCGLADMDDAFGDREIAAECRARPIEDRLPAPRLALDELLWLLGTIADEV